jgi:hypothetical protein
VGRRREAGGGSAGEVCQWNKSPARGNSWWKSSKETKSEYRGARKKTAVIPKQSIGIEKTTHYRLVKFHPKVMNSPLAIL